MEEEKKLLEKKKALGIGKMYTVWARGLFQDVSLFFSEDSNDHLTTQDLMSLPTSTPVQV